MEEYNYFNESNNSIVIAATSQAKGCPAHNIFTPDTKKLWLSETGIPQSITLDMSALNKRPQFFQCLGIHCWHSYSSNPKTIELLVSSDGLKFIIWSVIHTELKAGTQLFNIDPIGHKYNYMQLVIRETYGASKTYINNVYLYEKNTGISKKATLTNDTAWAEVGSLHNYRSQNNDDEILAKKDSSLKKALLLHSNSTSSLAGDRKMKTQERQKVFTNTRPGNIRKKEEKKKIPSFKTLEQQIKIMQDEISEISGGAVFSKYASRDFSKNELSFKPARSPPGFTTLTTCETYRPSSKEAVYTTLKRDIDTQNNILTTLQANITNLNTQVFHINSSIKELSSDILSYKGQKEYTQATMAPSATTAASSQNRPLFNHGHSHPTSSFAATSSGPFYQGDHDYIKDQQRIYPTGGIVSPNRNVEQQHDYKSEVLLDCVTYCKGQINALIGEVKSEIDAKKANSGISHEYNNNQRIDEEDVTKLVDAVVNKRLKEMDERVSGIAKKEARKAMEVEIIRHKDEIRKDILSKFNEELNIIKGRLDEIESKKVKKKSYMDESFIRDEATLQRRKSFEESPDKVKEIATLLNQKLGEKADMLAQLLREEARSTYSPYTPNSIR